MKVNHVFLRPINIHSYRRLDCGIPLVTGLVHVEVKDLEARLCYEVTYDDGFVDYIPKKSVEDGDFKFVVQ